MKDFKKLLGQVSLLIAISLVVYILAEVGLNYRNKKSALIEQLWSKDIERLSKNNNLPLFWRDLRIVEKMAPDEDKSAKRWIKTVSIPIEVNPKGSYKLELLFLSQEDDEHERVVILHHIIHIPSGNSVWELGRTYSLK